MEELYTKCSTDFFWHPEPLVIAREKCPWSRSHSRLIATMQTPQNGDTA